MASFNEEGLRKKLADLNMSQQSIQTMSLWLIHHKKHAHNIVNIWYKELVKAQEAKKLAFMYLANDVIQNSKRKGPEYNKEFIHRLPKAFKHLGTIELEEKALKNLNRLLQVWEERGIFDSPLIQEFKKRLGRNSKENQPERKAKHGSGKRVMSNSKENQPEKKSRTGVETYAPKKSHKNDKEATSKVPNRAIDDEFPGAFETTIEDEPQIEIEKSPSTTPTPSVSKPAQQAATVPPTTAPKPAPEPEQLIQALQDLENAATADAEVRKQIAGLPPAVSDISGLSKLKDAMMGRDLQAQVDKALSILDVYNKRLAQEMEARKSVARLLHDYISHQKDVLTQTEEILEVHRAQYHKVQRVRHELRAHLQNLPDISKLPNLDGGLAPLPSAGDLFT